MDAREELVSPNPVYLTDHQLRRLGDLGSNIFRHTEAHVAHADEAIGRVWDINVPIVCGHCF